MILVVGGNGYIGRSFCEKLVKLGEQVISLDISATHTDRYTSIISDVRDRKALEKVFSQYPIIKVVNLAAILVSESKVNPRLSFQVNVIGNYNLLELSRKYGISRFVFSSSYAVLGGPTEDASIVDEKFQPRPENFYGDIKAFVESLGMSYAQLCGFQFIAARLPLIVGPGEPTSTSAWRANMFNLLTTGGELTFDYASDQVLQLAHYEDAAEALAVLTISEQMQHHLYHLPYEDWPLETLRQTLQSLNPSLKVTFGSRLYEGAPKDISFERFVKEFNFQQVSLKKHLEKTVKKSI